MASPALRIRPENDAERETIGEVTALAFATAKHSSGTEAQIVERLRADGDLLLSLVAIVDSELVGHAAFSPVLIDGAAGPQFGVGPVSVLPSRQRAGVGSALIEEGLARLGARNAQGCVVFGDPGYYSRFGFSSDARPFYPGAPPGYFMQLTLGSATMPSGPVAYAKGFAS